MRTTLILATAFLASSCDASESSRTEQMNANDAAAEAIQADAAAADGIAAEEMVSTEDFIARAAMSDLFEIQSGELAAKNGQSQPTRQFGQMMVDDHTKSSQDMKAALDMGDLSVTIPVKLDAEHQAMFDTLSDTKGEAFDREYHNQQMMGHRKALALHNGYAANGDDAGLKAFSQNVVPVIQKHHDQLNQLHGATNTGGTGR